MSMHGLGIRRLKIHVEISVCDIAILSSLVANIYYLYERASWLEPGEGSSAGGSDA